MQNRSMCIVYSYESMKASKLAKLLFSYSPSPMGNLDVVIGNDICPSDTYA